MYRSCNTRPRPSRLLGLPAALLAIWFGVGEIGSFAHQALIGHATCAEHGESIHVSRVRGTDLAATAHASHHDLQKSTAPEADADHDHCAVTAATARPTPQLAPLIAPARAPHHVVFSRLPASPPARLATYRVAPKNSPPA